MVEVNGVVDHGDDDINYDELDLSDLEDMYKVSMNQDFDSLIVVEGLPIVSTDKKDKLLTVVARRFGTVGKLKGDNAMFMPLEGEDDKAMSKGVCFIEYETPEQASVAIKQFNNLDFDRRHRLLVTRFVDVETYAQTSEEFVEPPEKDYEQREHIRSWLKDPQGRDQFLLYRNEELSVCWNRRTEAPDTTVSKTNWTETYVQWSPLGSYLSTIHRQGIQLWGGPSWNSVARFPHPFVKLFDFSPKESYVVTWSRDPIQLPPAGSPARERPQFAQFTDDDEGKNVCVWDVQTGNLLRSFEILEPIGSEGGGGGVGGSTVGGANDGSAQNQVVWPMFKWSPNEKYFARISMSKRDKVETLQIYQTPDMGLMDKTSMKIPSIKDFEWSPAGSEESQYQYLCYWTPELNNQPARVSLMSVPTKETIRTKNLFNVADCKLHWQSEGKYLCVKVDRYTKTKKSIFTNLEIFHIKQRNTPVEVVEVKDVVIAFAWEPKGDRFIIITCSEPTIAPGAAPRSSVSVFCLDKAKGSSAIFKHFITLERKNVNAIFWSPRGRFFLLAALGLPQLFEMEFYDLDYEGDKTEGDKDLPANLKALQNKPVEHYGMTDIEWDPSGRYVASVSSFWKHGNENGYQMRDFRGNLIRVEHLEKFKQLFWRPRPQSLLTEEDRKRVSEHLGDYAKQFEDDDAAEANVASQELIAHRRRLYDEWKAWRAKVEVELESEKANLRASNRDVQDSSDEEVIDEWIEEVIEETEEIVD